MLSDPLVIQEETTPGAGYEAHNLITVLLSRLYNNMTHVSFADVNSIWGIAVKSW